jgi:hypothetical protein
VARTRERPQKPYLGSVEIDHLARMNTELLSELWILRDRVTVLEHLLEQGAVIKRADLDAFVPQGALAAELEAERARIVERVVGATTTLPVPDIETLKRDARG